MVVEVEEMEEVVIMVIVVLIVHHNRLVRIVVMGIKVALMSAIDQAI
jgi:hypothetical protein